MDEQNESGKEDVAWLCGEVVRLFRDASAVEKPDHGVCVKYAQILRELLPVRQNPGSRASDAADVAALRRALQQGMPPKSATEP